MKIKMSKGKNHKAIIDLRLKYGEARGEGKTFEEAQENLMKKIAKRVAETGKEVKQEIANKIVREAEIEPVNLTEDIIITKIQMRGTDERSYMFWVANMNDTITVELAELDEYIIEMGLENDLPEGFYMNEEQALAYEGSLILSFEELYLKI